MTEQNLWTGEGMDITEPQETESATPAYESAPEITDVGDQKPSPLTSDEQREIEELLEDWVGFKPHFKTEERVVQCTMPRHGPVPYVVFLIDDDSEGYPFCIHCFAEFLRDSFPVR